MLQWLLRVVSFPGNSQIVFSRSGLGRSCATGAFSHCQASNRELPAQKSRHISHQEYWNLRLINVLPFIFHNGAEWNHPFKLEKGKNEQLRQVSVLFTHSCSLPDTGIPVWLSSIHSRRSLIQTRWDWEVFDCSDNWNLQTSETILSINAKQINFQLMHSKIFLGGSDNWN